VINGGVNGRDPIRKPVAEVFEAFVDPDIIGSM
jgi:hypothetical protein